METSFLDMLMVPPPIHPEDPGSSSPGSILLDLRGYVSERTNHTTAEGFTQDHKRIQVTFWVAHPPRASCFTVHIPDLKLSALGDMPRIINTEEDLVLLRVPICDPSFAVEPGCNDFFIYRAGTRINPPSLKLIPAPPVFLNSDRDIGLLRCRDGDNYYVAVLRWVLLEDGQYDLNLYSSKKKGWSTKRMELRSPNKCWHVNSDKVITIGGKLGLVAWVDFSVGILLAELERDHNRLRFIPLPAPLVARPFNAGAPLTFRDIIARKGYIRYFEMRIRFGSGPVNEGWKASLWKINDPWKKWEPDCSIEVSEPPLNDPPQEGEPKEQPAPVNDTSSSQLPLNPQEGEPKEQLTLKGLFSGYPALSLHDADVVYITDRNGLNDTKASVIAVDVRKQTLKGVADFGSGRPLDFFSIYVQSGISKHLNIWSTARDIGHSAETGKNGIAQEGMHAAETNTNGTDAGTRAAETSGTGISQAQRKIKGKKASKKS